MRDAAPKARATNPIDLLGKEEPERYEVKAK
jgi:hypothetical protein